MTAPLVPPTSPPAGPTSPPGPVVTARDVTFRFRDADDRFEAVGLMQELQRPRDWLPFERDADGLWTLTFPRPAVDRMEYQLKGVFVGATGDEVFADPGNPLVAPGAFGDKSVIEFPGYAPPRWLDPSRPPGGEMFRAKLPSRTLRTDIAVRIWTSAGADAEAPLPLLLAHDGGEYAQLSSLLGFLDHANAEETLPPLRAALLDPPWPRDEHYSASAAYARALVTEILPALEWLAPTPPGRDVRVAMGASLGALALLHAQRLRPQAFAGLYLQSGSYFRQRYDKHESGFPRFRRISRFVGEVLASQDFPAPVPVVVTCGAVEENLANNRAVAAALEAQGYEVTMVVNRDAHNYVGWRDTFDPHLTALLNRVWRA